MTELADLQRACAQNLDGYAAHAGFRQTPDWLVMKLAEEVGEVAAAHLIGSGRSRKPGTEPSETRQAVARELADVVGFALALAHAYNVDIGETLAAKWRLHQAWEPAHAGTGRGDQ